MADRDSCRIVKDIAANIMRDRQAGVDIIDAIDFHTQQQNTEEAKKFVEEIVLDAYEHNEFSSEEYREDSIREFSTKYFLECMRG